MSLGDNFFLCDISASVLVKSTSVERPSSAERRSIERWPRLRHQRYAGDWITKMAYPRTLTLRHLQGSHHLDRMVHGALEPGGMVCIGQSNYVVSWSRSDVSWGCMPSRCLLRISLFRSSLPDMHHTCLFIHAERRYPHARTPCCYFRHFIHQSL